MHLYNPLVAWLKAHSFLYPTLAHEAKTKYHISSSKPRSTSLTREQVARCGQNRSSSPVPPALYRGVGALRVPYLLAPSRDALGCLSSLLCQCDSVPWDCCSEMAGPDTSMLSSVAKTVPCLPPLSEHGTEGNPGGASLFIGLQFFLHSASCHPANDSPARWAPWWLGEKCYCTACHSDAS